MRAKLSNAWENATSGLWFLPSLLVIGAAGLAALFLAIDERAPDLGGGRHWLFGGTADSARALLSAIAGSLITVVALAFSITIVAVQQASSQFSPRVIRNFMRDRANQFVFGAYIATFVYALLILRQVRQPGEGDVGMFVPALSITAALAFALLCMALLIYYIHHIATSLQAATITDEIRRELREGIDVLYPEELGEPLRQATAGDGGAPAGSPALTVRVPDAGYLRAIDEEQLLGALGRGVVLARVRPQIGEYVLSDAPLVELWYESSAVRADEKGVREAIAGAFTIERERSTRQDILFGIRQLVDIALKALSPGINDPTTAEHCLSHLGDVVAQLAGRPFPPGRRYAPDLATVLEVNRPDFAAIVDAAFSQIRRQAQDDVHVTAHLLGVLREVAVRVSATDRAVPIRRQVGEVLAVIDDQSFTAADKAALRARADAVFATLDPAMAPFVRSRGGC